jgi:hypothetical protein
MNRRSVICGAMAVPVAAALPPVLLTVVPEVVPDTRIPLSIADYLYYKYYRSAGDRIDITHRQMTDTEQNAYDAERRIVK